MMNISNFNNLFRYFEMVENDSLHLNEFRKNLTSNLDRSPLIGEPLNFVPFTQYSG